MTQIRLPVILSILLMLMMVFNPLMVQERSGVEAWTDGNKDSPIYPHYGIVDLIADQALWEFNKVEPEKAEYLMYWYLERGADSDPDSFDPRTKVATSSDNFLAWTDDDRANDGDRANYFIHNSKGWEITDAPTVAQQWADWAVENLTAWFMEGKPEVSNAKHRAAYCTARMSRYVSKMAQYSRTDYSQLDQVTNVPIYNPNEVSYQMYYEAYLWNDQSMIELAGDFRNRTFDVPDALNASTIYDHTADVAKYVNSRDGTSVQMVDHDSTTITVGKTYKQMLDLFIYNWENGTLYNDTVRGFNDTLWELTLQNLVAVTQNMSAMYEAIYDMANFKFITTAPDLTIVDYSYEPEDPISGDMITVNATIRNNGPTSTRDAVLIEISTYTAFVNTRPVALEAYQEKNVTFSPFMIGTTDSWVKLRADPAETLAEPNEFDNELIFNISPREEIFDSDLELAEDFASIRRDTIQPVKLLIHNLGNRYDEFLIKGATTADNVYFDPPDGAVGVPPYSTVETELKIATTMDTELGNVVVEITADGERSISSTMLTVEVLDRSKDPVPVITGLNWTRVGMDITLSARGSSDPDGDSLYFTWKVPEWGNFTGPEATFNYTRQGTYVVILEVYDGNLSVELEWPINVYSLPPENLSAEVSSKDVSGITIGWRKWNSGGLVSYWLEASALPGQGGLSNRGPYVVKVDPGSNSARIGGFHPQTDVQIILKVETDDGENRTMDILETNTTGTNPYSNALNLYINILDEGPYLYLQYKPWIKPEAERLPIIVMERWSGSFVTIPADTMEEVQSLPTRDTYRYPIKSNWGLYRATLSYIFSGEDIEAFSVQTEFVQTNVPPEAEAVNLDQKWELNVNGTCSMHIIIEIKDPNDHIIVEATWGDGTTSTHESSTSSASINQMDIYHNYTEIGLYDISLKLIDWSGDVRWINQTVEVHKYSPPDEDAGLSLILMIVLAVIATIFIVGMLIFLGKSAYKFAKKDTEVEFDMDSIKSKKVVKAGTGTDFDQRRSMQIPQESIMAGAKKDLDEEEEDKAPDAPMIQGNIVFDEE